MGVTACFEWVVVRKCLTGCVSCSHAHREIKLGLKTSVFGGDYLWQEILFFFFPCLKENYIFLWTFPLSGAKVGCGNMGEMSKGFSQPAHFSAYVTYKWFSLPPIFFFPQRKIISSQPNLITLFLELLVVIWVCILAFMSLSTLC